MILCEEAMDLICLSQDEELTEEEKSALREHLEICPVCRDFRNTMHQMSEMLKDPEPIPKGLHARIMDSIVEEAEKKKSVSFAEEKRKRRWQWKRISVLAACLIFALLVGFRSASMIRRNSSVQYAKSVAAEPAAGKEPEEKETTEEKFMAAPAAAPEAMPTPCPTIVAEENSSTSDVMLFMSNDEALAAGSESPAEEEADQKRILLDEILAFLNGKPVISLATAEITEPDYTIAAIYDGKETELFLWNEETGLSYTWDMADGWLYQSEHTVDELYSFMDSLYG